MHQTKPLRIAENWYEIADVGNGVSHILETHVAHWMRCNMWLIRGRDRDLLVDSGMGLRPLKAEISALRERPVTAVCSHCHFDHIGCAYEFDIRLGHKNDANVHAHPNLDNTCARSWIASDLLTALPRKGYSLAEYQIKSAPLTGDLDDGDVLDTGDRAFDIFHLPGHAPGSIALYEKATRTLFSGDIIYDGLLIDSAWHSDPEIYRESLSRLKELPVETIHAGHEASFGRDRMIELIDTYLAGGLRMPSVEEWLAEQAV